MLETKTEQVYIMRFSADLVIIANGLDEAIVKTKEVCKKASIHILDFDLEASGQDLDSM